MTLQKVGTFILTDESLDRHSQRVLVEGTNLSAFKANPLILYNHLRGVPGFFSESTPSTALNLPIGIWKNIRRKDGALKADAWIDFEDEVSARIGRKIQKGILKAASIGMKVLAVSDAPEDKVKGQKGVTITKSEILEASIVDIPANPNALMVKNISEVQEKGLGDNGELDQPFFYLCNAYLDDQPTKTQNTTTMEKNFNLVTWAKSFFGQKAETLNTEDEVVKFLEEQKPEAEVETPAEGEAAKSAEKPAPAAIGSDEVSAIVQKAVGEAVAKFDAQLKGVLASVETLTEAIKTVQEETQQAAQEDAQEGDEFQKRLETLTAEIAALKKVKSGAATKTEGAPKVETTSDDGDAPVIAKNVDELLQLVKAL